MIEWKKFFNKVCLIPLPPLNIRCWFLPKLQSLKEVFGTAPVVFFLTFTVQLKTYVDHFSHVNQVQVTVVKKETW